MRTHRQNAIYTGLCPYCGKHSLMAYQAKGGVYLACAEPWQYGCPDATEVCASLPQARARALDLAQSLQAQREMAAAIPGRVQLDLFGQPVPVPIELKKKRGFYSTEKKGYAALPGTGPEGQTCRKCAHYRTPWGFPKCGLMERYWTHGAGSDIKAASPACKEFKPKEEKHV